MTSDNLCNYCVGSKTCFLCGDFSDRGGLIYSSGGLSLCSDGAPLTERHLLLFPDEHHLSFRNFLGNPDHSLNIKEVLADIVQGNFENHVFFEHGAGIGTRSKGCVEHAHIHILRLERSEQFVRRRFLAAVHEHMEVERVYEGSSFEPSHWLTREGQEYVWLRNSPGNDLLIIGQGRGQRQVARRLLCAALDIPFRPFCGVEEVASHSTSQEINQSTRFSGPEAARIFLLEGLSASGKSTIANHLALEISGMHIPSGLFYCAAAIAFQEMGLFARSSSEKEQLHFLRNLDLQALAEEDASEDVRLLASRIFQNGNLWLAVNERIVAHVTRLSAVGVPCVVDGRGMFGQWGGRASEFYLSPRTVERKKRFMGRLGLKHLQGLFVQTERDRLDTERTVGRLEPGPRSVILDTTNKTPQQTVSEILGKSISKLSN